MTKLANAKKSLDIKKPLPVGAESGQFKLMGIKMNIQPNIPHNTDRTSNYHSSKCVDPINCPVCRTYVESVKIDLSTFSRLLKDFDQQFGGGRE